MSEKRSRDYDYTSSSDILHRKPSRSFSMKGQKPPEVKLRSILSRALAHFERATDDDVRTKYIREMWEVVEAAWQQPVIGRDLAYEISDTLRREKVVNYLVMNLQLGPGNMQLKRECARLLSQILTTDNRHYVSKNALDILTKYTKLRTDIDLIRINICILESLFKDSEATCSKLFDLGALDAVIHACRHDDLWTARYCAAALANAAIFGGGINHKRMVDKGAPNWIFPLAFRSDDFCRFYACLAVTVLAANPLVESAVVKSGTLSLVEPFVQSHDPYEFAQSNPAHAQGRSASFLQRMVPLLISSRPEAQALAAFYFAMEASIKAKQQKTQIFSEVCSIIPLKRVIATSRSNIARILSARCLKIIGEDVPRKLSSQIHLWDIEDVQSWLTVAGFRGFHAPFRASTVDGEMLLLLTETELKDDLEMVNNVHRKRFLRDLNRLRAGADYRSVDSTGIADWLRNIDSKFVQYTYRLLQAGVDRSFLSKLTDAHLSGDCGIVNGVHRTKILTAAQGLNTNSATGEVSDPSEIHDVFISYRRNNGSHLASLLRVHLQMRGFQVFLDVDSLPEGDFADKTLKSVKSASAGFILILTAGALDKCAIDHEGTDWVHKEIVTAITNRRNIVPVTTETFQWPLPEDLPQDIAPICYYNGVKWVHEYQDACVDKIVRFLRGQDPPITKLSRIASVQSSRSGLGVARKGPTHPNRPVRPSRSSDNLVETNRAPRPHKRGSPPGQDSQGLGPAATMPVTRGVTGAQSESARSLDQGDGASAPMHQNPQYKPALKSPTTKTPDLSANSKKNLTSPSSVSTTSSTSAKNVAPLQKDMVEIRDVMDKESSSQSHTSESDTSDYTSSEGEERWEPEEERGGADGKSKADSRPVKPLTANTRTVVAQVEPIPSRERDLEEEERNVKSPPQQQPTKVPSNQSSPERKLKPSTKYKAPAPPPHYDEAKHMPVPSDEDEPDSKPLPSPRLASTSKILDKKTALDNRSSSQSSLSNGTGSRKIKSPSGIPKQKDAGNRSPLQNSASRAQGNVPKTQAKPAPVKSAAKDKAENGKPATTPKPQTNQENKPPSLPPKKQTGNVASKIDPKSAINKPVNKTPDILRKPASADPKPSDSDYSDSTSNYSSSDQSSNVERTNADGNDDALSGSLSRSSVSTSSDSSSLPENTRANSKKPLANSNNNNNGNSKVNGVSGRSGSRLPTPQNSSSRSTPLSRSSHSAGSPETGSPPRSPARSTPQSSTSKPVGRRDVVPAKGYKVPPAKRSASERLQLTRPPPPNYPIGSYQSGYPPQPNNSGYNMEQYKAAMAASIRAPYPGHQVYPQSPGHSKSRAAPPAHGFDTAV